MLRTVPQMSPSLPLPGACPDENVLVGFVGGALPAPDVARLEAHLDGCADCRALVGAVAAEASVADAGASPDAEAPTRLETGASTLLEPGADPKVLPPGTRLGPYVLRELLGMGGMGVVYAAEDPRLGRRVALKLLRPARGGSQQERRERLLREAKAMARLSHPNVLPLFDLGSSDGRDFLAMEWVEGTTLAGWLRERERPWREVLALFLEAGEGLAAAHRQGLVHRDFKPSNVLVGRDGRARVTDFGIARWESSPPGAHDTGASSGDAAWDAEQTALTREGMSPGTPAYMSPEQRRGLPVDARSDQYSFCVALYEALHGERPGTTSPRPPTAKRPRLPRHVREALTRGLSPTPDARYPSMEGLLRALATAPRRRGRWVGGVLAVSVLVSVGYAVARRDTASGQGSPFQHEAITLGLGATKVLPAPGLFRLAVGEPSLVEVALVEDGVQLTGRAPGETQLLVWSTRDGEPDVYRLTITAPP
ncbi:protein kinase [Myxococcus sp. K15C18031901]|uniref:protein kinase domain-containing protein n=1 Tax=Myxococcus dinghuensis TaxID=2906761 RepID=UPI0020A7684D|nr:protein kinase [Myxococcus dinghuensis]MCP3102521.1 protein kinase [Myxococcus dinghuensis]